MKTKTTLFLACLVAALSVQAKIKVSVKSDSPQALYAATLLEHLDGDYDVKIVVTHEGEAEGFTISKSPGTITISANDDNGAIYGANFVRENYERIAYPDKKDDPNRLELPYTTVPEMKLRGACVGLQKTEYLPGHSVYEYPYTPENFPWFYNKELWIKYLDMLAENNMNTVYLWNGHPFASLVKLSDYPFSLEVDDATLRQNQEMFAFLTTEAGRRGIRVIQMFYNIILSKPFADHYGLKTQDRHRPITPLIADYTRKSIAAFVEQYPNVGFLVCLGEAMATIEDDITWMTETIIPGIRDGLAASGRTDTPPIILRSHDTDGPLVLQKSLPLYPNIFTMTKYTGESLTTYEPGGPWAATQRQLAASAPLHISNVHILANLEPWRWSSPAFAQKAVMAMHNVHGANGLHLYPQASYWDWPFTADKLREGGRLLQIDRDWMWYKAWGRYAWNCHRGDDREYWKQQLSDYYGIDTLAASCMLRAYDETGEIAPKLIRRFGITEGNRQTLLLGMRMAQLVNPYKFTVYPGFYESCGPKGEKLIEFVEKEHKHQAHVGELPLDIVEQCVAHAQTAREVFAARQWQPTRHQDEFNRVINDFMLYDFFARSFRDKVLAARYVLDYKWSKDVGYLDAAAICLENSLNLWKALANMSKNSYLYANSMQTAQRRIPVGGDHGNYKTWSEMVPVYQEELDNLKLNILKLKTPRSTDEMGKNRPSATPAAVVLHNIGYGEKPVFRPVLAKLEKGARLFENREEVIDTVAPELLGLQALVLNRDTTRIKGTTVQFSCDRPVKMLVGFFIDEDTKFARPTALETDASANEYGQAEPLLLNAVNMTNMPTVNIHAYHFAPGFHTIALPKGILMIAGFTEDPLQPRDCELQGAGDNVDWLFTK